MHNVTPTDADYETIAKSVWDALKNERANPNNSLPEELKQLAEKEVKDLSEKAARAWWKLRTIYKGQNTTRVSAAAAAAPAASPGPMAAAIAAASSGEGPAASLGAADTEDWDA